MRSWYAFGTLARGHVDHAGMHGTYGTWFSKLPYALWKCKCDATYNSSKRRRLWEQCVNTYLKKIANSPCYHVVITCLFRYLSISSDLLFSRLFPLHEFISSFSFRHKYRFLLLKLYRGHALTMLQVAMLQVSSIKLLILISFDSSASFA